MVEYAATGIAPRYAGRLEPIEAGESRLARFGVYDLLTADAVLCDGTVTVTTLWEWTETGLPPATLSLFAQLLDSSGQLVDQVDSPPLGMRFDLVAPVPGWGISDRRAWKPVGVDPVRLLIGMYDFVSGARLPATGAEGEPIVNDALVLPVRLCAGSSGAK